MLYGVNEMDCKTKIKELRESTGMNRKEFCKYFQIPYRTVTEWELDNRHAPEYVLRLLEYYIQNEGLAKKKVTDECLELKKGAACMKKTKTKCYLYTRVSTSMQVDGYSLDAQRDKLRKYAEYEDMVVAGEYSDEGFSGKNIQGRHEFQRMLQDIQDCKDGVEYVLVFKLSRFGRNAADVLNSLQLMQDFGVNLICVEDGIDSSKDSGKLMISVLSAVAEIERENIRTQTMAGREQKAREGKWNGGFAPYGYRLEKGELLIAEDEVDVIRTIFDRYIHTNDGVSGVAKYLNRQGFVKKLRQNGTIPGFSASFVKSIIDNPVYMGKIAYGRRRTEKKIGTRNEMHVVEQSEFPVYEGKHEAIISEEDWNLAQEKRKINAYRREKVNDPTHAHILSGILKCPCCGKSLYGNIAKAHSKDKKTRYYYYCKNTVTPTGHECTFRLNIEQMEMNRMVASIISAMVSDPRFADAIKAKIGSAVDTNDLEKQLEALQAQLRQTLGTKARLERQMDGLDVNDPYYDRKISDLQRRYDEQYGAIDEIEVQIDDVQSQIRSIRQEKISGDNIYRLLLAFDQVYEAASEVERKEFMRAFIERIELFPEKQPDGNWIRKIIFNFPVPVNGTEVKELPLENETIVETFQYKDYADRYSDAYELYGYDAEALFNHYETVGKAENRVGRFKKTAEEDDRHPYVWDADEPLDPLPPLDFHAQPDWFDARTLPENLSNVRIIKEYEQLEAFIEKDEWIGDPVLVRKEELLTEMSSRVRNYDGRRGGANYLRAISQDIDVLLDFMG